MTDNNTNEEKQMDNEAKTDPAETYNPSTRLPKKRLMVIERPGNINYAAPGGSFPGSRAVMFVAAGVEGLEPEDQAKLEEQAKADYEGSWPSSPVEWMNLYFKHRANLLTVVIQPTRNGDIMCVFTNHLEGAKLEHFQKYQSVVAETMEKWEAEQEVKREQEAEEMKRKLEEQNALIELGKKAREHNLLGKLKELGEQVDELRKENNKLKKEVKKHGSA